MEIIIEKFREKNLLGILAKLQSFTYYFANTYITYVDNVDNVDINFESMSSVLYVIFTL